MTAWRMVMYNRQYCGVPFDIYFQEAYGSPETQMNYLLQRPDTPKSLRVITCFCSSAIEHTLA
ncbi:uncharacterized protein LACBIDRAFT_302030 [Laccaria bicolor S238N-H82]|uniref:Predicted protein n=1 Tax=Laccaria bicolor (strain S238N-H82 / ATCC MYA-4686) TaxID=486041 RepID=B0CQE4_LACBS|nr:uncharacterized protein LACBIDRAFT_302030 [Laccaria bicolor S238N-H82]EDR15539.1 predicted protein [Laccaria bicolor S238N-H82]|eukprot:XP_001873747.1 predicted protein [Laccaria bicolor S238N-H82]